MLFTHIYKTQYKGVLVLGCTEEEHAMDVQCEILRTYDIVMACTHYHSNMYTMGVVQGQAS